VLFYDDGGKAGPRAPTHDHRHGSHPAAPRRPVRHPPLRTHPMTPPNRDDLR
jgi:hypothetical protein